MVKKSRKSGTVRELERRLSKALQKGNNQITSDLYVDIAEEFRRGCDFEEAIDAYKKCLEYSAKCAATENAAFAHRAIAEMSIEPSVADNESALTHGKKYFQAAEMTGQVHLVQLAYHVYGWLQFQIYLNTGAKNVKLLNESKVWCERGLAYLNRNAVAIDSDEKAVRIGQNSRSRKARLRQVLSQIYDKLGLSSEALFCHNAAFSYAVKDCDFDLQFRCLLSKLNFSGDQRLKTAVDLVHVASNLGIKEHADAKFILAQEKVRVGDFEGALWDFVSMFSGKEFGALEDEEKVFFQQCMVAVYKAVERLHKTAQLSKADRMKTYEKIADEFIELDFRETSLDLYKKMLNCAELSSDKLKALVSVAETARELGRYDEALDCFLKTENIESAMTLDDKKRAETAICIAIVATKAESISAEEVESFLKKAEKLAVTARQKIDLYEAYLEYVEQNTFDDNLSNSLKTQLLVLKQSEEDDIEMTSDDDNCSVEWNDVCSGMSDAQILARCEAFANRRNVEERIKQEKDKKINSYGETRMHEAARGNDIQHLRLLVKAGYNVNARDEGGWTPLHEAIGALKLENVRILIEAGACLDIRSNEGTLSADGERTDSGGLTPLMEACDRGSTDIASVLLKHGANVSLRNKDNWTALDFFKNAVQVGMVEDEDMHAANKLISLMETKLRQANVPVNKVPPPKKLPNKRVLQSKAGTSKETAPITNDLSPDRRNLFEYRRIMRNVGRGEVHERTSLLNGGDEGMDPLDKDIVDPFADLQKSLHGSLSDGIPPVSTLDILPEHEISNSSEDIPFGLVSGVPKKPKRAQTSGKHRTRRGAGKRKIVECPQSDSEGEIASIYEPDVIVAERPPKRSQVNLQGPIRSTQFGEHSFNPSASPEVAAVASAKSCFPHPGPSKIDAPPLTLQHEGLVREDPDRRLLFVKIIFKRKDGSRIKAKGIPFSSFATVSEIRARCIEELSTEGEVSGISISQDDCELSDETPIGLVLTGTDTSLDCIVGEVSKLTPLQTYLRKSTAPKSNVIRAFNDAVNGILDLSDFSIGREGSALLASLSAFSSGSLSEVCLNGNALPVQFLDVVAELARHVSVLRLESCALVSKSVQCLLGDKSACCRLLQLDLGYNDIGGLSSGLALPSFISLCPNLRRLRLPSCSLNVVLIPNLLDAFRGLSHLESIDVSHNCSVSSETICSILKSCGELATLYAGNTGFKSFESCPELFCKLERIGLCGCAIDENSVIKWLLENSGSLIYADLSHTAVRWFHLEDIAKQKSSKQPLLCLKLFGCNELEADYEQLVESLHSYVTTDITVRFQFSSDFRHRLLSSLSPSFAFCIK